MGERFLAGLYCAVPHHGTKRGTTLLRGQWTEGVQVYTWRKDRKDAIAHYERARALLIGMGKERPTPDRASKDGHARSGVGRSNPVPWRSPDLWVVRDAGACGKNETPYGVSYNSVGSRIRPDAISNP